MNDAVLILDIGNSRIKWAMFQDSEWLADGFSTHDCMDTIQREWARFPTPHKVIGCNVAGKKVSDSISDYWLGRGIQVNWVKPSRFCAGASNLYDSPEQLGPDRWAALVGAWHRVHGACLVVSAGTALTVDALNQDGEFIGGFILPGKRLMHESLVSGTHALNEFSGKVVEFPKNTADGMASGVALSMSSSVQAAWQRLASKNVPAPICLVTGGDAEWLANYVQIGVIIAPRLIMEGLLIMAREAEQT